MAEVEIAIGTLRWQVTLARRRLNFDPPGGVGIFEDFTAVETVYAAIEPLSASTFYGAEAIDTPVSHRITLRWRDYLDNTNIVLRDTLRPGDQTIRREVYRIRRVKELNGRKRFSSLDCELERVELQPAGSAPDGQQTPNSC